MVKFIDMGTKKKVRIKGYNRREELKAKKLSCRVQWPREIMDKRKPLYPIVKREKDLGKDEEFVREKLYVDGVEYTASYGSQKREDDIKIISWNVFGMERKLGDTGFTDFINQYQIVFLCETWVGKNETCNLEIPGYQSAHSFGSKSKNTKRGHYSGGLAV